MKSNTISFLQPFIRFYCYCTALLIFSNTLSAQSNEPWPYDSIYYYDYNVYTFFPSQALANTLSYIEVYQVNSEGYRIQMERIPWDTVSQTFQEPEHRWLWWPDDQGRDTLREFYEKSVSGYELTDYRRRKFNDQGILVYQEFSNFSLTGTSNSSKSIFTYSDDGRIMESISGSYDGSVWVPARKNSYTYEGSLLTSIKYHYKDWSSGLFRLGTEQISTYDANGNKTESIKSEWSEVLGQMHPNFAERYTYDEQNRLKTTRRYRRERDQDEWIFAYRDSILYPAFGEEVKIRSHLDIEGSLINYTKITTTQEAQLDSYQLEKYFEGEWKLEDVQTTHYDKQGKETKTERLRLAIHQPPDTTYYHSSSKDYINESKYLSSATWSEKHGSGPLIKHYTAIYSIREGFTVEKTPLAIRVFPNPTQGEIKIALPEWARYQARVYSIDGRLVHREIGTDEQVELNLQYLVPSIYLLQVQQNGKTGIKRVIVRP